MSQSRQLAAIMFTDIVGYSALMAEDEEKAFDLLRKNRAIQRPIIEQFNGRWLKEIGDGVLASFSTVTDAVYCAATIQKSCENVSELNLRIGIHLGEVIFENDDVFGDGVNIASRLEPLAPIGGILVSESVHKNLLNKQGIRSTFVREEQLKNFKEKVRTYQVAVSNSESFNYTSNPFKSSPQSIKSKSLRNTLLIVGAILFIGVLSYSIYYLSIQVSPGRETDELLDKSVVVLPFADLSSTQDQSHFCDGMMEEIINHLVKIDGLKVISWTTALSYKQSGKTASEIAKELGVATVLEGSANKEGDSVRIKVRLTDGKSNMLLFSESYDQLLNSIFRVQSDVSKMVAKTLQAHISPNVEQRIDRIPTLNTMAYELYLKGREQHNLFWSTFNTSFIEKSLNFYYQSTALDSTFSNAYTAIGQAYWGLAHFSPNYDPDHWRKSKLNLQRAIELDPDNGRAYAELGVVQHNWNWDQNSALLSFKTALRLNPADPDIHNHLRYFYFRIGDCDKAQVQATIIASLRNREYDPELDLDLMVCRRDLTNVSRLSPSDYWFDLLNFQERYEDLIRNVNDSSLSEDNIFPIIQLGEAYAFSGDSLGALSVLNRLEKMSKTRHVAACYKAAVYMAMGMHDKAFELLEKGLEQREWQLHTLTRYYISMYRIQDDPRFIDIISRSWIPQD